MPYGQANATKGCISMQRTFFVCLLFITITGCASTPDTRTPAEYFSEAETLLSGKNYDDAIAFYRRAKESYASPDLTAAAELRIADTQFAAERFVEAAASYEEFVKNHPLHEKAPYALFRQGLSNWRMVEGIDLDQTPLSNAVELFDRFLRSYPKDPLAQEAKDLLETCRTMQLKYEIYVGRHYARTGRHAGAIRRLERALNTFPGSPLHDETLYYLGISLFESGEKERGKEVFRRLGTEYPASPFVSRAAAYLDKNY